MLAAQVHKSVLKKIFLWKNIFLKSAGKMSIFLKVQGKCLYYPSGNLKIVFDRPAGFLCLKNHVLNSWCRLSVCSEKSVKYKIKHTVLQCVYPHPQGFVNTSPPQMYRDKTLLCCLQDGDERRGSWSERVPSLPSYPSTDRFILKKHSGGYYADMPALAEMDDQVNYLIIRVMEESRIELFWIVYFKHRRKKLRRRQIFRI